MHLHADPNRDKFLSAVQDILAGYWPQLLAHIHLEVFLAQRLVVGVEGEGNEVADL